MTTTPLSTSTEALDTAHYQFMSRVDKIGLPAALLEKKLKLRIIVIGESGAGKTTFAKYCADNSIEIVHGTASDTSEITAYPVGGCSLVTVIDVPGTSDSNNRGDANAITADPQRRLAIRKFLSDSRYDEINLVVWCTRPNARYAGQDHGATLRGDAAFIHALVNGNWPNVLTLAQLAVEPTQSAGPSAAIEAVYDGQPQPPVVPWHVATPNSNAKILQGVEEMGGLVIRSTAPVIDNLLKVLKLAQSITPIKIVDSNQQCYDCHKTGEPSTWNPLCHISCVSRHGAPEISRYHSGNLHHPHRAMIPQEPYVIHQPPHQVWRIFGACGLGLLAATDIPGRPVTTVVEGILRGAGTTLVDIGRALGGQSTRVVQRPDICADCGRVEGEPCLIQTEWACCPGQGADAPGCLIERQCTIPGCNAISSGADELTGGCIQYCPACELTTTHPDFTRGCIPTGIKPHVLVPRDD